MVGDWFIKAAHDAPKQWVGPPTAHTFLDILYHWKQYRDDRSADLTMHTIQHQASEARLQARDEAARQYQQWLQQGEAKGLRGLFRCLKASELAWQRPYRHLEVQQRMPQRIKDWGKLWKIRDARVVKPNNMQPACRRFPWGTLLMSSSTLCNHFGTSSETTSFRAPCPRRWSKA